MNAGLRDALPVPPAAEVVVGQPARGYVVLQKHLRDVQTARARRARAIEELRLLLTEERTSRATEIDAKSADSLDELTPDGHVDAERRLAAVLEDERAVAVILD